MQSGQSQGQSQGRSQGRGEGQGQGQGQGQGVMNPDVPFIYPQDNWVLMMRVRVRLRLKLRVMMTAHVTSQKIIHLSPEQLGAYGEGQERVRVRARV